MIGMIVEGDKFWVRVLQVKYLGRGSFFDMLRSLDSSHVWKSILAGRQSSS